MRVDDFIAVAWIGLSLAFAVPTSVDAQGDSKPERIRVAVTVALVASHEYGDAPAVVILNGDARQDTIVMREGSASPGLLDAAVDLLVIRHYSNRIPDMDRVVLRVPPATYAGKDGTQTPLELVERTGRRDIPGLGPARAIDAHVTRRVVTDPRPDRP